jgi:hypothetical protein
VNEGGREEEREGERENEKQREGGRDGGREGGRGVTLPGCCLSGLVGATNSAVEGASEEALGVAIEEVLRGVFDVGLQQVECSYTLQTTLARIPTHERDSKRAT